MAKNRSPFACNAARPAGSRACFWIPVSGVLLLSVIPTSLNAGQVIEDEDGDENGYRSRQATVSPTMGGNSAPVAPAQTGYQQYSRDKARTDAQTVKGAIAIGLGLAIGQAAVQSISQGNQTSTSPPSSYRQNPAPEYSPYGGRRPIGERF